uniref:Putative ovule protein n=1 Tax=Solanum chacoense TaxID=4108 RepID=A0A0V0H1W6_SOLCH
MIPLHFTLCLVGGIQAECFILWGINMGTNECLPAQKIHPPPQTHTQKVNSVSQVKNLFPLVLLKKKFK